MSKQAGIEQHVRFWKPAPRGTAVPRPVAAWAWRCEGQWQAYDQMDIWECVDLAELDERRKRGEDDDEDE